MVRKQIYLEESTIKKIKEIASSEKISESEFIRQSLKKHIEEKISQRKMKNPLLDLIGISDSDITDGSINHDECIYRLNDYGK
jgi:hypothetical protein